MDAAIASSIKNGEGDVSLESFAFKEVLGEDSAHKVAFLFYPEENIDNNKRSGAGAPYILVLWIGQIVCRNLLAEG